MFPFLIAERVSEAAFIVGKLLDLWLLKLLHKSLIQGLVPKSVLTMVDDFANFDVDIEYTLLKSCYLQVHIKKHQSSTHQQSQELSIHF